MESPSLSALDRVKVLVLGDVMLDRYWHGDATRISPEAPVPVVHVRDMEQRAGGAANVAVNVASLGASAFLLGVTGDDDAGEALGRLLSELGVDHALQRRGDGQTVTKLRILSRHQQLLRLDMEGELPAAPDLTERFRRGLAGCDAAVLSDYGKGTLSDIQPFIRLGREACVPVLVDPKGTEFTRYRGASVVTPNLREFEAVVGRCRDREAIAERAERLRCELDLQALLITRGGQGMTLVQRGGAAHHVPANDLEVYDVTGAGDTAIAVFATALGAGFDMPSAMGIANRAAGIVVTKLGTAAVSVHELQLPSRGVVTTEELSRVMQAARAAADTVVMTNGCFDILHAGHASYLERARALGDCLVVAVQR